MSDVLENVRRALGRNQPLDRAPIAPPIDEPTVRLVHSEVGLPELLVAQARKSAMGAELVHTEELAEKLIEFLKSNRCRKIAVPASKLLESLQLPDALIQAGFELGFWSERSMGVSPMSSREGNGRDAHATKTISSDSIYEFDCGLTDCYAAIAETGSLVVRASPEHGRCLSLVPPIHIAIIEPRLIVPDLLDLMEKLSREKDRPGTAIITGPSKTSDIEGNLVTGVHGPGAVHLFVLK